MGIILFNNIPEDLSIVDLEYLGFRPLMGIILFNLTKPLMILPYWMRMVFPSPNGDYFI